MKDFKVLLDVGNGFLKGMVFAMDENGPSVVAKEILKTKGMRKGKVLDIEEFTLCIHDMLDSFAKKLGGDFIDEIYLGVSHPDCHISRVSESKRVMGKLVEQEDIMHLSDVLTESASKPNYELLKIMPVYRQIDEEFKVKDALGMEARKIELVADVFQVPRTFYNNLMDACARLDLKVIDIVPNILGSAEAVLDAESKDLGVVVIDIGSNQTSYVVYEEGVALTYGVLPMGGEDVTKDISIGLQVDINEAERIKKEKGKIEPNAKLGQEDGIDMGFLSDIMVARYEEIFDYIQNHLVHIKRDGRLAGGVYLLGGGSQADNVALLARQVFKLASFTGVERNLRLGDTSEHLQWIPLLGLYTWIYKYHQPKKKGFGLKGIKMDFSRVGKVGEFLKQLF